MRRLLVHQCFWMAEIIAVLFLLASRAVSQQAVVMSPPLSALEASVAVRPTESQWLGRESSSHPFWDRENRILFAAVAGSSAADFAVTYSNLSNGGKELNPVTRLFGGSTAGLAFNFAGETAGVVGISYFFHRTGHHKLERIVAMTNIGASGAAVSYDLMHR